MMTVREKTIQNLNLMLQRNHINTSDLNAITNKKGFLYAIVDEDGVIQTMRKTLGTANRVLNLGKFNILSGLTVDVQKYQVVSVHIDELELKPTEG